MTNPLTAAAAARRSLDDAGSMSGIAKNYTFRCVGNTYSSPSQTRDVAAILNVPSDDLNTGEGACTITQTTTSGYTLQQIAEHFALHPCPLVNWNIPFATNANVISSMKFFWIRKEPDGTKQQRDIDVATQLTPQDFQSARVQFIADGKRMYDGQTYVRFVWDSQNPAVTAIISLSFGPAVDLRALAKEAEPVRIG